MLKPLPVLNQLIKIQIIQENFSRTTQSTFCMHIAYKRYIEYVHVCTWNTEHRLDIIMN